MKTSSIITTLYSIILIAGGIRGYLSGSLASLLISSISGALLLIGAYGMAKEKLSALYATLFLLFFLDALFSYRFMVTSKWMPAGMLCVLTLATICSIVFSVRKKLIRNN